MSIFINRILNLKSIKAIGFDMDYTIVRYNSEAFEALTYQLMQKKLIENKGYPKEVANLTFNFQQSIRGLVIDRARGNFIKLSLWGKIKKAVHGTRPIPYKEQEQIYRGHYVDLSDPNYRTIDTSFSMAYGDLLAQLIDMKDQRPGDLPNYQEIEQDVLDAMDLSHRDGSLKDQIVANKELYIIKDPDCVRALEAFKRHGKKVVVVTNSDYAYTNEMLSWCIDPYLKDHKSWKDLFEWTVTLASKPRFFTDKMPFLAINPDTGLMSNVQGEIQPGIYQGGNALDLQKAMNLQGEQILYLGDHIYGDILALKKTCHWRTALVVEELAQEVDALKTAGPFIEDIDELMEQKAKKELELNRVMDKAIMAGDAKTGLGKEILAEIDEIDGKLTKLIVKYNKLFNPYWGEIMRAGQEESRFAGQVQKYACVYMSKVSDFVDYSPRTYFRAVKRILPHELHDRRF